MAGESTEVSTASAVAGDVGLYRQMVLIREFEDVVQSLFREGLVPGTTHLCQGQEAVAVGVAAAMQPGDYSTYTYRGHGHVLARGMTPEKAFAEIMGRATGCNHGKGGSMHLTDATLGLYGCFAVVGAGIPISVGLARGAQLRKDGRISVTFFGDGATNIGAFHEALNLAAVWNTPSIFVCENNLYGEYTRYDLASRVDDLADRAQAYGMPGEVVDGNDVWAVREAAERAAKRAREGLGPSFLECKTYRQRGHSRSDPGKYRPDAEVAAWMARDPIILARRRLVDAGAATESELDLIRSEVVASIAQSAEAARQAPLADLSELTTDVYA